MSVVLKYTVHSAVTERVPVAAVANGQAVTALVDRLVVELVPAADDHDHGHTFRLPVTSAEELTAQVAAFQPGAAVTLTITTGDAA